MRIISYIQFAFVPLFALFLVLIFYNPTPGDLFNNGGAGDRNPKEKIVIVRNNHSAHLSIRCFSFTKDLALVHLGPKQEFSFKLERKFFLPQSTMFNCSTNMGVFVVYNFHYECAKAKYANCTWEFNEDFPYLYDPQKEKWIKKYYQPTFESVNRGGVFQSYYTF